MRAGDRNDGSHSAAVRYAHSDKCICAQQCRRKRYEAPLGA